MTRLLGSLQHWFDRLWADRRSLSAEAARSARRGAAGAWALVDAFAGRLSALAPSARAWWRRMVAAPPVRRAAALTLPSAIGAAVAVWFAQMGSDSAILALGVACGALVGAACAARIGLSPPEPDESAAEDASDDGAPEEKPAPIDPLGGGRAALEAAPAPVMLIDGRGRLTFANAAARSELSATPDGRHYSSALRAPGFFEAVEDALARRTPDAATGPAETRQFAFALHGRQERHLEAFVTPLRRDPRMADPGDLGSPRGPARAAEERPAALVLILDQTRARRAEQLHRDFVANASHELKTPLASIAGFIETLRGAARDDAEARERFLEIMAQQAERMRLLVNDLMSLNRIELNEHVRPRDPVDLRAALEDAIAVAIPGRRRLGGEDGRGAPEEAGGDETPPLEIDWGAPGPVVVLGDRAELTQLFANLLSNAVKYGSAKRGPRILLRREATEMETPRVGVTIEDFGPGIAREHLPRLTERFYRVDTPSAKPIGGTGLGLAIVKHVLARHRGELEIDSALGRGSRFTAWLPEADPAEATAARSAEAPRPSRAVTRGAGGAGSEPGALGRAPVARGMGADEPAR